VRTRRRRNRGRCERRCESARSGSTRRHPSGPRRCGSPAGLWLGARAARAVRVEVGGGARFVRARHPESSSSGRLRLGQVRRCAPLPRHRAGREATGLLWPRARSSIASRPHATAFRHRDSASSPLSDANTHRQMGRFRLSQLLRLALFGAPRTFFLIVFSNRLAVVLIGVEYISPSQGTRLITRTQDRALRKRRGHARRGPLRLP